MAWRIDGEVAEGEIDNRTKGRVSGWIRLAEGRVLHLRLAGNAWPDIAGSRIRFRNPAAVGTVPNGFSSEQDGVAGDITASRKVKDLLVPVEAFLKMTPEEREGAYRWANSLYIEWYSRTNGRVVIESARFAVEVVDGPLWTLSEDEQREQAEAAAEAMQNFLGDLAEAVTAENDADTLEDDDEEVIPPAEAEMDAEAARMDLLSERIERRLRRNGETDADWAQIYEEESARLRRERSEPEPPPPTPEEEAEAEAWIEEMNAAAGEALKEEEAERWKGREHRAHPLVTRCRELAVRLRRDGLRPAEASPEHPLNELADGVLFASGKLAGALGIRGEEEWPPDALQAPSVLVFLKKARGYLRDALRALDSIDEEALGTAAWRKSTRSEVAALVRETRRLIAEARRALE